MILSLTQSQYLTFWFRDLMEINRFKCRLSLSWLVRNVACRVLPVLFVFLHNLFLHLFALTWAYIAVIVLKMHLTQICSSSMRVSRCLLISVKNKMEQLFGRIWQMVENVQFYSSFYNIYALSCRPSTIHTQWCSCHLVSGRGTNETHSTTYL